MIHHAASGDGPLGLGIGKLQTIHVPKLSKIPGQPASTLDGRKRSTDPKSWAYKAPPAAGWRLKPCLGIGTGKPWHCRAKIKKDLYCKEWPPTSHSVEPQWYRMMFAQKTDVMNSGPPKKWNKSIPYCTIMQLFKSIYIYTYKSDSFALILRLLPMTLWRVGHLVLNSIALERANTWGLLFVLHIGKCQRVTNPF